MVGVNDAVLDGVSAPSSLDHETPSVSFSVRSFSPSATPPSSILRWEYGVCVASKVEYRVGNLLCNSWRRTHSQHLCRPGCGFRSRLGSASERSALLFHAHILQCIRLGRVTECVKMAMEMRRVMGITTANTAINHQKLHQIHSPQSEDTRCLRTADNSGKDCLLIA